MPPALSVGDGRTHWGMGGREREGGPRPGAGPAHLMRMMTEGVWAMAPIMLQTHITHRKVRKASWQPGLGHLPGTTLAFSGGPAGRHAQPVRFWEEEQPFQRHLPHPRPRPPITGAATAQGRVHSSPVNWPEHTSRRSKRPRSTRNQRRVHRGRAEPISGDFMSLPGTPVSSLCHACPRLTGQ